MCVACLEGVRKASATYPMCKCILHTNLKQTFYSRLVNHLQADLSTLQ